MRRGIPEPQEPTAATLRAREAQFFEQLRIQGVERRRQEDEMFRRLEQLAQAQSGEAAPAEVVIINADDLSPPSTPSDARTLD